MHIYIYIYILAYIYTYIYALTYIDMYIYAYMCEIGELKDIHHCLHPHLYFVFVLKKMNKINLVPDVLNELARNGWR